MNSRREKHGNGRQTGPVVTMGIKQGTPIVKKGAEEAGI
jgi:hypothetical protein